MRQNGCKVMFKSAKPIWVAGKSDELNCQATFSCEIDDLSEAVLHITGATFYRIFLNDRFIAFGPARTAKGYARVDSIKLAKYGNQMRNKIVIEAMGYRCNTLSTVNQKSFIQAEVRRGDMVLAYTGRDFNGYLPQTRVQKVMRYSYQRHFGEIWDFRDHTDLTGEFCSAAVEVIDVNLIYLPRVVGYPIYDDFYVDGYASWGSLIFDEEAVIRKTAYSVNFSPAWGRFEDEEIRYKPFHVLQQYRQHKRGGKGEFPVVLDEKHYVILDLAKVYAGFIQLEYRSLEDSEIIIGFSENCSPEHFQLTRMNALNVLQYLSAKGSGISALSFEPYTFRYAIVMVVKGQIRLEKFGVKEFSHPAENAYRPQISDPVLANIYEAAIRTFCHNAVDLYTDCPSRERSGWLCDSYFMAQAEYLLFGKSDVEQAFLENYAKYKNVGELPLGMLPMCYPSDMPDDGRYIPQWAMWYVIELDQYLKQRNPAADREVFRPLVFDLLAFLTRYENEYGLLENLPGWNFIEWTRANDWYQDVNFPTNMLYAEVLDCVTRIYGDNVYAQKAAKLRQTIAEMSYNGEFFVDNAVRKNGKLIRTTNISEVCQYYAVRFGIADFGNPRYDALRHVILNVFGPGREDELNHIIKSNAFIGVYLRLEVLLMMGEYEILCDNIKRYFGPMSESTGTLWEYLQLNGSHDHGFASFAALAIARIVEHNVSSKRLKMEGMLK